MSFTLSPFIKANESDPSTDTILIHKHLTRDNLSEILKQFSQPDCIARLWQSADVQICVLDLV